MDLHHMLARPLRVDHFLATMLDRRARGITNGDLADPHATVVQHTILDKPHAVRAAVVDDFSEGLALEHDASAVQELAHWAAENAEVQGRRDATGFSSFASWCLRVHRVDGALPPRLEALGRLDACSEGPWEAAAAALGQLPAEIDLQAMQRSGGRR